MPYAYLTPAIRRLRDHLLSRVTRLERLEYLDRAEKLLLELEPNRWYAWAILYERIAGGAFDSRAAMNVTGEEVRHDLLLLIEDVSDASDIPAEMAGETVLTLQMLSKRLAVSLKTISRWRRRGLAGRRFRFGGRKRVGFLASTVERFVAKNLQQVRRGSQSTRMKETERLRIIEQARRLAGAGTSPAEIIKQSSRASGRSLETVRYVLRQHDEAQPGQAILPERTGAIADDIKRKIFQQHRRGDSIESLAQRYGRGKSVIQAVLDEMQAARILEMPLEYIPNDQFAKVRAGSRREAEMLGPPPPRESSCRPSQAPKDLPPYLAGLYDVPLLNQAQEVHLFRKMNYLKYRASRLRERLATVRFDRGLMTPIEKLFDEAVAVKNGIVAANLRLVVSIAKRYVRPDEDLFELISDGNMSLIRAVEKFDYARGNRFSTYATWAIVKNFARSIADGYRRRDRFRTSAGEVLSIAPDSRDDLYEQESDQQRRELQIARLLNRLDLREREILIRRFGLTPGREPMTLKQVGAEVGVTKERIRQIEHRALRKLLAAAREDGTELLEVN